jgi:hypothetical protein
MKCLQVLDSILNVQNNVPIETLGQRFRLKAGADYESVREGWCMCPGGETADTVLA